MHASSSCCFGDRALSRHPQPPLSRSLLAPSHGLLLQRPSTSQWCCKTSRNGATMCNSTGSFVEYDVSEDGRHYDRAYSILSSLIVPRPIALVTTRNADGGVNAAPFSFFNILGVDPPIVAFAPSKRPDGSLKDTTINIKSGHNFVVNVVDEDIATAMNSCAAPLPYGDSELTFAGLTAVPSSLVSSPRILQAPASLECEEYDILTIGNNNLVIGLVKRVHIRADLLLDVVSGRIDRNALHSVGRMQSPGWYCLTKDAFLLEVPKP